MELYFLVTVKRLAPCRCLDRHVKEPYKMSMALGAQLLVKLLLQSTCTSMCRHIYNWSIVACDVKQPVSLTSTALLWLILSISNAFKHNHEENLKVKKVWQPTKGLTDGQSDYYSHRTHTLWSGPNKLLWIALFSWVNFRGLNINHTFVGLKIHGHRIFLHNSYRKSFVRGY